MQFFILSFSFAHVSFCSTTKVFSKLYVTNLSFTQLFFENSNAEQFAINPYLSIATAGALCMANWNSLLLFDMLLKRESRVVSGLINSFVLLLVCLFIWFFQNNELKTCQNSYLGWGRTSRESKSSVILCLFVFSAKLTVVVLAHASQIFFFIPELFLFSCRRKALVTTGHWRFNVLQVTISRIFQKEIYSPLATIKCQARSER